MEEEKNETENNAQTQNGEQSVADKSQTKKRLNVFSWAGLILSAIGAVSGIITAASGVSSSSGGDWLFYVFIACAVAGIALGIAGTVRAKKLRAGKAMGIAAIIIGALSLLAVLAFYLLIIYVLINLFK